MSIQRVIRCLYCFWVLLLVPPIPLHAFETADFADIGSGIDNSQSTNTLAWNFSVKTSVQVTRLGYYDDLNNGPDSSQLFGIYDASTQNLLASAMVSPTDPLNGAFRYTNLSIPITFLAGKSYVIKGEFTTDKFFVGSNTDVSLAINPSINIIGYSGSSAYIIPSSGSAYIVPSNPVSSIGFQGDVEQNLIGSSVSGNEPQLLKLASASFVEPNNTPEQATPILVNDTPTLQLLDSVDNEDWFEFYAKADVHYSIEILGSSIGKRINPALQLFDKHGLSMTDLITRVTEDQSVVTKFTTPSTDLYRIRVTNQAPFLKITDVDNAYQLRVYLTDAPQQGLLKGIVINNCDQQGVVKAEVAALIGNGISDSTLTHKTGEFGLLLNPNQYQLKSSATNFQDTQQAVSVNQLENDSLQLIQSPKVSCKDYISDPLDPLLLEQRAVAVYDDISGLLVIRDVLVGSDVYYVELQDLGNFRFQLTRALKIPSTIHAIPGEYSIPNLMAKLPAVFALGKTWDVQMQDEGAYVFRLIRAEPK